MTACARCGSSVASDHAFCTSCGAPVASGVVVATAAAGWYPDPSGSPTQRYFDGTYWTEHTTPAPAPSIAVPVAPPESPRIPFGQQPKAPFGQRPKVPFGQDRATKRGDANKLITWGAIGLVVGLILLVVQIAAGAPVIVISVPLLVIAPGCLIVGLVSRARN